VKTSRFAGIMLVNPEREVLLQLRGSGESLYPNHWTLPGGRVEAGESPRQAIVREVKEELDLDLHRHKLFEITVEKVGDEIVERYIFSCSISKGIEEFKLGEGVALKYFSLMEIPSIKIGFGLKTVIEKFMKLFPS
jgi:8-oxo-dGTP diphosphatase